ncbi:hypothetical protein ACFE04_030374 [Oxalis oulophora]
MWNNKSQAINLNLSWKINLLVFLAGFLLDLCRWSSSYCGHFLIYFLTLFDLKTSPSGHKYFKGVKTSDIIVDDTRNLWFRLYTPSGNSNDVKFPLVVFFHGGGFLFMAPNSILFDKFCYNLARELRAVIVSVNYRLAHEHPYPCQYVDGFDVLKYIDTCGVGAAVDLKNCFLSGDSAGGNLAHHVALRAGKYNELKNLKVAGLIALQPFFGGEERTKSEINLQGVPLINPERTDWIWKRFLPNGDRDHAAVNVFGPNSIDISGVHFPKTIVFVGGFDPLKDWQRKYHQGLKKSGKEAYLVEYPKAFHTFYLFPELPESDLLMEDMRSFIYKIKS